mmetsp:Transcript_24083/g.45016  ORF Transcript_24083/g.45016 Transcript_24083/m.45016 type:complete len:224 (-) Transcript_24083:143-814(-)
MFTDSLILLVSLLVSLLVITPLFHLPIDNHILLITSPLFYLALMLHTLSVAGSLPGMCYYFGNHHFIHKLINNKVDARQYLPFSIAAWFTHFICVGLTHSIIKIIFIEPMTLSAEAANAAVQNFNNSVEISWDGEFQFQDDKNRYESLLANVIQQTTHLENIKLRWTMLLYCYFAMSSFIESLLFWVVSDGKILTERFGGFVLVRTINSMPESKMGRQRESDR